MRTLLAFCLADYLVGPPSDPVEKRLCFLESPALGKYDELLYHLMAHLSQRLEPPAFLEEARRWYFTDKMKRSEASERIRRLIEIRNHDAHQPAPAGREDLAALTRGVFSETRRVLQSLAWLQGWRPFRVCAQSPARGRRARGKIQFLTGNEHLSTPEMAEWRGELLPDLVYLSNPRGDTVLELSPFVRVCDDPRSGAERFFLLQSVQKMKRLVLLHDELGSALPPQTVPTEQGEQAFDRWLQDRPKAYLRQPIEDVGHCLGWYGARGAQAGQLLDDRFEVRELLGEGGMAHVYRVWDRDLEEEFALKVLKDAFVDIHAFRERFLREARQMRRIRHPSIMRLQDVGRMGNGGVYLKMPVMEHGSLADHVVPGGQAPEQVLAWGGQILAAVAHLHEQGIIHRDLKPANLLMGEQGRLFLADFGIALADGEERLTASLEQVGSLAYMAPEQRLGGSVTDRSDVFSSAMLLHELLEGHLPVASPGTGVDSSLGVVLGKMGAAEAAERPTAREAAAMLAELAPSSSEPAEPGPPVEGPRPERREAVAKAPTASLPVPAATPAERSASPVAAGGGRPAARAASKASAAARGASASRSDVQREERRAAELIERARRSVDWLRATDDLEALRLAVELVDTPEAWSTYLLCASNVADARIFPDAAADRRLTERARSLVSAHPRSSRAWYALGVLLTGVDDVEAIEALERAIELDGGDAHSLLWLAVAQRNLGREREALISLGKGEHAQPGSQMVRFVRGHFALLDGAPERALEQARAMLSKTKRVPRAWYLLCRAQADLEQHEVRVSNAAAWCKVFPHSSLAAWQHGLALSAQNEDERAVAELERATTLRPDFSEAWVSWGWQLLGAGALGEALTLISRAKERVGDDAHFAALVAYASLEANRLDDALKAARIAARAQPASAGVAEDEALCLLATGDATEARRVALQVDASESPVLQGILRLTGDAEATYLPGLASVNVSSAGYRPGWATLCAGAFDTWQPPREWSPWGHVPFGAWVAPEVAVTRGDKNEEELVFQVQKLIMANNLDRARQHIQDHGPEALRVVALAAFEHCDDAATMEPAVDEALFSLRRQGTAPAAIERARLRVRKIVNLLWARSRGVVARVQEDAPRTSLPSLPFGFWCQAVYPVLDDLEAALPADRVAFQQQVAALVRRNDVDSAIRVCNAVSDERLLRLGVPLSARHSRVLRGALTGWNRGAFAVAARLSEALGDEKLRGASSASLCQLIVAADHVFGTWVEAMSFRSEHVRRFEGPNIPGFGEPGGPRQPPSSVSVAHVRVGLVRSGKIADERIFTSGQDVFVGTSPKNQVVLTNDGLGRRLAMLRFRRGQYWLQFTDKVTGKVAHGGAVRTLTELTGLDEAVFSRGVWRLPIDTRSRGKIVVGDETLLYQFV